MLKVNRIELTGVVIYDPQVSRTDKGTDVLRFRLGFIQGEGDRRATDNIQCVVFGHLATQNAAMPKGAMVYVAGEFQIARWQKDGGEKSQPQVLVSDLRALECDRERLPLNRPT